MPEFAGKPPVKAGEVLRWGFAILSHPDVATALLKMRARHRTTSTWTAGLRGQYLPGLPRVELLGDEHLWISVVVTGQEELIQIVERLLPEAVIEDAEISQTFADKWRHLQDNTNMGIKSPENISKYSALESPDRRI